METKFTPRPWTVKDDEVCYRSQADDQTHGMMVPICIVTTGPKDARLIAAAPDLLEALDQLLTDILIAQGNMNDAAKHDPRWEGCAEAIQPRVDAARAAIAKATT